MRPNCSTLRRYRKTGVRTACFVLSLLMIFALLLSQPLTASADTLTLIKPNGGETLIVGSQFTAEWTGNGGKEVYVYVSVTEPYQYYLGSSTTSIYTFTVPNHPTTQAKVQIEGAGIGGDTSDNFVTIKSGLLLQPVYPIQPIQPIQPINPLIFIPLAPTDLTILSNYSDSINLTWKDNATNEEKFEIQRKTSGGTFAKIDEVPANTTTYEDTNVITGNNYSYQVRAVNGFGASNYSNTVTGTTMPIIAPPAGPFPANLTAQPLSATEIQLNWKDMTMGNDVFHIERDGVEIATVMDTAETYRDTGLEPDTNYTYRLRMEITPQDPRYSDEASARTLAATATPVLPVVPPVIPELPPVTPEGETILYFDIDSINYYVNGERRTMDAAPAIFEGRTVLPIKYVAEPLGAAVGWDPGPRRVRITHQTRVIDLWIGQNQAQVNGSSAMIDPGNANVTPIVLPPGRTMLPLKFIAEQMGALVEWDPGMRRVTVTYQAP